MADTAKGMMKINKRPKDDVSDDESGAQEQKTNEKRLTLGYWNIQGLGSPARMMLNYGGVDFENKTYNLELTEGGFSLKEWTDVKPNLGLDFPNLPYLKDSETGAHFTESSAIYRYIAREFKIGVQGDPQWAVADMMNAQINALMAPPHGSFIQLAYHDFSGNYPDELWKKNRADYIKALPDKLKGIEAFMKGRKFVTGDDISWADFPLYYLCYAHQKLDGDDFSFLKAFPNLAAFYQAMGELEQMKKWRTLEWSSWPCNNKIAAKALQ